MRYIIFILCMFALPSFGQITRVVSGSAQAASTTRIDSATLTLNTTAATVLHVMLSYAQYNQSTTPTIVDNTGSTWILDTTVKLSLDVANMSWHCSPCSTSVSHNIVVVATRQYPTFYLDGTTGESNVRDGSKGKTSSTTSITSATLTPTQNNCIVYSFCNTSNQNPTLSAAGFTQVFNNGGSSSGHAGLAVAYSIQTVATSVAPTWNISSANSMTTITNAFRATPVNTRCTTCDGFDD